MSIFILVLDIKLIVNEMNYIRMILMYCFGVYVLMEIKILVY